MKKRKMIDQSMKLEAIRMLKGQSLSVAHINQNNGFGQTLIRRWLVQFDAEPNGIPGIGNPLTAEQMWIRQLEHENRLLRSDVNVLKKASAFFVQEMTSCIAV